MQSNSTVQAIREADLSESRARRAVNISAIVLSFALIGAFARTVVLIAADRNPLYPINIWIFIGITILALVMARQKRVLIVVILLYGSGFILTFRLLTEVGGVVSVLTGTVSALGIILCTQLLPRRQLNSGISIVIVTSLLLIIVDQFWPFERIVARSLAANLAVWITVVSLVMMVVFFVFQFHTYSIQTKLVLAAGSLAIFAVLVLTLTIGRTNRTTLANEIGQDMEEIAEKEALAMGELLLQQVRTLEALALNPVVRETAVLANNQYDGDEQAILAQLEAIDATYRAMFDSSEMVVSLLENPLSAVLQEYRDAFPENVEVFVTDRHGALLGSTNRTSDYYQADEAWWQAAFANGAGRPYLAAPGFDQSSSTFGIDIAVPIYDTVRADAPQREVIGVLRTTYDLETLASGLLVAGLDSDIDVEVYVPDTMKLRLEPSGRFRIQQDILPLFADLNRLAVAENPFDELEINGTNNLVSLASVSTHDSNTAVDQLDWQVVVLRDRAQITNLADQQERRIILISILMVLFVILSAGFIGLRVSKPIVSLTETAKRVQAGDLTAKAIVETEDEIGQLALSFNDMTEQLRGVVTDLEYRISERTRALQIAAVVGREISAILDPDELVTAVVDEISQAFNYYHAHIYTFDDQKETLIMRGGTGEVGEIMLQEGHQLPKGRGLVWQAAEQVSSILVSNVAENPSWLPNPLLPDTKSEMAVPIVVRGEVLGVIDVQQNRVDGLSAEDVTLLEIVAGQVGTALQNARLFAQAQEQARQDELLLNISRKIQSTTDVASAMQVALRELGSVTGAKTRVIMKDPTPPSAAD